MVTIFMGMFGSADWATDIAVQIAVITGVWYMSVCECDMLVETAEEMGGLNTPPTFVTTSVISAAARRKPNDSKGAGPPPAVVVFNALSLGRASSAIPTGAMPYELV